MRHLTSTLVIAALTVTQAAAPLSAQMTTMPVPETRPVPLPRPVPDRPVPLPRPIPDRPYPGGADDYAGRITCESRNGRLRRCPAQTEDRVVLLTRAGGCTQSRTWGYDRTGIWVSGNCRGTFAYGYRYGGAPGPGPGVGDGYANSVRCESRDNRRARCNVRTENRVVLVQRHNGTCTQGRTWNYDRLGIWVANNCRATFVYGYGNYYPQPERDKDGPSTGLIIGGVAVAAGLIALLASRKKKPETDASAPEEPQTYPPGPPATISADLSGLSADQRPAMQTCLFEAARQVGATGGTRLRFDRITKTEPGNGGWRFNAALTSTYPDGERETPIYCRATSTKVVQLDFTV